MSSSHNIERAISKAQNTLLLRFMFLMLLCLLLVELAIGALFFFDLYRAEKKILTSMASEYQRILTYDSAEQLTHVLKANPHRLIDNNIAAYAVDKRGGGKPKYVAGDWYLPLNIDLEARTTAGKSWINSFILSPYISIKIKGDVQDFWLVLDNEQRYFIAIQKWLMTFYALVVIVIITALFTRRIIRSAMTPLVTLGDLLDKVKRGKLDLTETPAESPEGLSVISSSVQEAITRLQHTTTTLNTTVDAIAHDVRTPLSRITLSSQAALLDGSNPKMMQDALSDCAEYATQASNMLTALMKLNDELMGKRTQQNVNTDVGQVIETVRSWYEDIADDKNIRLAVQCPKGIVIQSDPDKLTQILVNLVDNAIKYTPEEGSVSIEASTQNSGRVAINVTDTGVGIERQFQDLIFERLYRVDSSRSNIEGYGLGLSLALAMVENLEGTLEVKSALGSGSTFIVSL
ncbi:sensor histidine kinase [Vibrio barjaei]|uniref:sensor histidine kinase n=1 Tax=Vibrio barjaei TaxID=1676683 RepID=UPI00228443D9|nr:HAMP domain-containing sensor histidine kinase [Vibrio barjaei]MCY9870083.1 HAMP domain-containing sensor histidine kinase [Vibrio barjaei]